LILPNNILLQKIKKQHLYYDKKSKEPFTNKIKRKYKLAGNCLLEHYFFHVLTRTKDACKKACTLTLRLKDWENRNKCFQLADIGYCDLTKFDRIERVLLLKKIKDKDNGFPYVAKLSDFKYKELINLASKKLRYSHISTEAIQVIEKGILPSFDDLLSKLNLK